MVAQKSANCRTSRGGLVWWVRSPRCSGVKQNVAVTSKPSSASIDAIEPALRVRTQPVRPAEARAKLPDAQLFQPSDCIVEAWILEVEPLADAERGRVSGEVRALRAWESRPRAASPCKSAGNTTTLPLRGGAWLRATRAGDRRGCTSECVRPGQPADRRCD